MPRFEIKGKGRDSGRSRKRTYTADTASQARALAEADGTAVESVTRLPAASARQATTGAGRATTKKTPTKAAGARNPELAEHPVPDPASGKTPTAVETAAQRISESPTASAPANSKPEPSTAVKQAPRETQTTAAEPRPHQATPKALSGPGPSSKASWPAQPTSPWLGLRSR